MQSQPMFPGLKTVLEEMDRPPEVVFALNRVLRPTTVNLTELGCVARSFELPVSQLLKLCNSSIFALDHPVHSLEQAAIALGADALRSLSLAWGIVRRVGRLLAPPQAQEFWQHNLAVALISERIAAWRCYCSPDAYLAGFLHDIGRVPLMIAGEQLQMSMKNYAWRDESVQAETLAFGTDHCELGARIATRWEFPESLVRVIGNHHRLEVECVEPELVRIVSVAEAVCSRTRFPSAKGSTCTRLEYYQTVLSRCLPDLEPQETRTLAEALEMELRFATHGERPDPARFASSADTARMNGDVSLCV